MMETTTEKMQEIIIDIYINTNGRGFLFFPVLSNLLSILIIFSSDILLILFFYKYASYLANIPFMFLKVVFPLIVTR